jgi:RNA polymerase sigma factor (sigma-70 family)
MTGEQSTLYDILNRNGLGIVPSLLDEIDANKLQAVARKIEAIEPLPRRQCDDDPSTLRIESLQQRAGILRESWYENLEQFAPLDSEQMIELAKAYASGNLAKEKIATSSYCDGDLDTLKQAVVNGESSFDRMVEFNLRLVRAMAIQCRSYFPDVSIEDTYQAGCIGLMTAVKKWDWQRGYSFSTYATAWIRQSINREAQNTSGQARLPIHRYEGIYWDYAKSTWVNSEKERIYISPHGNLWPLHPPFSVEEILESPELDGLVVADDAINHFIDLRSREYIMELLLIDLDHREKEVLTDRFGIDVDAPRTLDEIGKNLALTRERIRQIECDALFKVRKRIIDDIFLSAIFSQTRSIAFTELDMTALELMRSAKNDGSLHRQLKKSSVSKESFEYAVSKALGFWMNVYEAL